MFCVALTGLVGFCLTVLPCNVPDPIRLLIAGGSASGTALMTELWPSHPGSITGRFCRVLKSYVLCVFNIHSDGENEVPAY